MKRISKDYILDILESIKEVQEFTKDMDYDEFISDRKTVNAVIRSLEVLGEASKKIPQELRDKYQSVPWKRTAGMRDKLIHEYHGVDLEMVWKVIKEESPPIEAPAKEILKELEEEET